MKLLATLALLAIPSASLAGDCFAHPVTLLELRVASCAPVDASNLLHVSRILAKTGENERAGALSEARQRAGVIVEATVQRTRTIEIDGRVQKPTPGPWTSVAAKGSRWLLYFGADGCKAVSAQKPVIVAHETDCGCDTGPHGLCAVDGEAIVGDASRWSNYFGAR